MRTALYNFFCRAESPVYRITSVFTGKSDRTCKMPLLELFLEATLAYSTSFLILLSRNGFRTVCKEEETCLSATELCYDSLLLHFRKLKENLSHLQMHPETSPTLTEGRSQVPRRTEGNRAV